MLAALHPTSNLSNHFTMAFTTCNGIKVFYEIHGTGTPLILISGLGGDHYFWQSSLAVLAEKFQVITFDTRGIGQTDTPAEPYSMDVFVADLLALLNNLQIDKAHLLGFSMGGNIALYFALQHPNRVHQLIIAASHAKMSVQIRLFVDAVLGVYEGGISTKQMFELIAPWLFSNAFLSQPEHAAFLEYDENEPFPQPLYAWKNQYLAQRDYDVVGRLEEIKLPTLILAADQDPFASLEDARILHQGIGASILKIIPQSGHLMNYEYPELFHECVLEFLEKA